MVFFAVVGGAPGHLLFDGAYTDAPRRKASKGALFPETSELFG
jgi:hypothetical protein